MDGEHKKHLQIDLQTLRDNQLYAKFSKYEFWLQKVKLLGYIVYKDEISVDSSKIVSVLRWNIPTNVTDVRIFLVWLAIIEYLWNDFSS